MNRFGKHINCFAFAACAAFGAGTAQAACSKVTPTRPGEVYLWRGLANVFSLGMDEMAKEFTRMGFATGR